MLFDLKTINAVLVQLEEEKGLSREVVIGAIEESLASAYKKEYGEKGQIIRAKFNLETGDVDYQQIKTVVDESTVLVLGEDDEMPNQEHLPEEERKARFNEQQHMMIHNAKLIKANAEVGEELVFPLESKSDFGRIAAQTAKQVIMQKIRSGEKDYLAEQFGGKQGSIVQGTVERVERGTVYVNLGKAEGVIPFREQIRSERFKTGDRVRAYLFAVDDAGRSVFLKLSRTHPEFLRRLFEQEVPELVSGTVEMKRIAREPGARSKVAVWAHDEEIDPIGSLVGQNGSRVSTITSELSGERIDIIEFEEDAEEFIQASLSPAEIMSVDITAEPTNEGPGAATVRVSEDQFSLAIGRGGQNVRLAAKLTGYKIDIIQVDAQGNDMERTEVRPVRTTVEPSTDEEATADHIEKVLSSDVSVTPETVDAIDPEADTVTSDDVYAAAPEETEASDAIAKTTMGTADDNTEPGSDTKTEHEIEQDIVEEEIEKKEEK